MQNKNCDIITFHQFIFQLCTFSVSIRQKEQCSNALQTQYTCSGGSAFTWRSGGPRRAAARGPVWTACRCEGSEVDGGGGGGGRESPHANSSKRKPNGPLLLWRIYSLGCLRGCRATQTAVDFTQFMVYGLQCRPFFIVSCFKRKRDCF